MEGVHDAVHDVQAWLEQVGKLNELINAKIAERDQVWALATKITPTLDDMPRGSGISDKVGDGGTRLADLKDELDDLIDVYVDFKQEVIRKLETLPAKEFGVLHRVYIRGMAMTDVADDMHYSRTQVYRIHDNGIKMLHDVIECYTIPVV